MKLILVFTAAQYKEFIELKDRNRSDAVLTEIVPEYDGRNNYTAMISETRYYMLMYNLKEKYRKRELFDSMRRLGNCQLESFDHGYETVKRDLEKYCL